MRRILIFVLPVETGGYDGTKSAFADCGVGSRSSRRRRRILDGSATARDPAPPTSTGTGEDRPPEAVRRGRDGTPPPASHDPR